MKQKLFDTWLLAVVILYGIIFALTPWAIDDFNYAFGTVDSTSAADITAGVWDNVVQRWHYDTGRLANIISPIFLGILSHWAFAILSALMLWISVRCALALADIPRGGTAAYILVFILNFTLPWLDFAFTVIFALNYLWTTALTLAFLYYLYKKPPRGGLHLAAACLLALVAAWMHEGFSAPVIAGITLAIIIAKEKPDKARTAMIVAYLAGFALILISPAIYNRLQGADSLMGKYTLIELVPHAVAFNIVPLAFLATFVACLASKRKRRIIFATPYRKTIIIFCLGATLAAMAIFFLKYLGPRLGWAGTVFATIALMAILQPLIHLKNIITKTISTIAAAAVVANLVGTIFIQRKYYLENEIITRLYQESEDGQIYYDNLPMRLDISCYKTSSRAFNEQYPTQAFATYHSNGYDKPLILLPEALAHYNPDEAVVCRADTTLKLYRHMLITDTRPDDTKTITLRHRGGVMDSRFRYRPFTDNEGTQHYLILPHATQIYPINILDAELNR